jgi:nucleotide-binding universal stress UspA family protein
VTGRLSLRTIVAGYDGTRPAEHALRRAVELARVFDARVVVADVAAPKPLVGAPGAFGVPPYWDYPDGLEARANELLWQQHREQIDTLFAETGVAHDFAGVVGDPAAEIVEVAANHDADLIVVGTHEPGLLERLVGGSVSQGVARRAHCDVLVVHPADEDETAR